MARFAGSRSPTRSLLTALAAVACKKDDSGPNPPGPPTDTAPPETETETETEPVDSPPIVTWPGWEVVETDPVSFGEWGYEVETWEVTEAWTNWFPTKVGTNRRFYLLKPAHPGDPSTLLNLVVMFHGGAVDDDSSKDYYADPKARWTTNCGLARDVSGSFIAPNTLLPHFIAQRGWTFAVPENLWCDFWIGRGPEDPVDPTHQSFVHVSEMLDFLKEGGGGFLTDHIYTWGSSSGGSGAVTTAHWYEGIEGVISDSPPCYMTEYFNDDKTSLAHIFGGDPYEKDGKTPTPYLQNYLDASCNWIVTDDGFDEPVYLTWNTHDLLAKSYNGEAFSTALDAAHPGRFGHHDYNHLSPGDTFHSQTRNSPLPYGYTTEVMFRFLEGSWVAWQEAEDGCTDGSCTVGTVHREEPESPWADASAGGGIEATPADGPGVMFSASVPDAVPTGREVTATLVIGLTSTIGATLSDEALSATYADGSGTSASDTFTIGDFQPDGASAGTHSDVMIRQYQTTQLTFVPGDRVTSELQVHYMGEGTARLDAILWNWR